MIPAITPQAIAEAASAAMHERDHAAKHLGITLAEIKPGFARMTMTVQKNMINGHDICHGGIIFTLADTAFAHACNSYNIIALASGCVIDFLAPAKLGDVLTAVAEMRSQGNRSGVYDAVVTSQEGKRIALFRGRSTRVKGEVVVSAKS